MNYLGDWKWVIPEYDPNKPQFLVTTVPIVAESKTEGWYLNDKGQKLHYSFGSMKLDWDKAETKHSK